MIRTLKGHEIIVLWDLASNRQIALLRFPDPDAQILWVAWASRDRLLFSVDTPLVWSVGVRARSHLLYTMKRDGSDVEHLGKKWFGRGSPSKISRAGDYLTIIPIQFEDRVLSMMPDDPDHVLVQLQNPRASSPGVYKLNVTNGRLRQVVSPQSSVHAWMADHDGVVRLGRGRSGLRSWVVARPSEQHSFEKIHTRDTLESSVFRPLSFSFNPRLLYVASNHEGDREAVYEYDLVDHTFLRKIFEHPRVDVIGTVVADRDRRVVESIDYVVDRPQRFFLDHHAEDEQAAIDRALPGRTNRIVSQSLDHNRAIVVSGTERSPSRWYLFDRERRTMDELFVDYPEIADQQLSEVRPVAYRTRDGLEIPAYLTIPNAAKPARLPVVVMPHGGPTSRDSLEFDPVVQFLASLGYAVFQPNFRGSSGYGTAHETSGYQEWGLAMQDDITDGVRWLIAEGIADPQRIAIFGTSYGGYAALMGLVKTPELYRCGASYAGVTDLVTMLDDDKWYEFDDVNVPMVGSTWGDRDRLDRTSPHRAADRIRVPVLIGHGEQDPTVHVKHARMMADALESAGTPVELVVYEDEIHGFHMETNRVDFFDRLADFLDRCMAPRDPS